MKKKSKITKLNEMEIEKAALYDELKRLRKIIDSNEEEKIN